MTSVILTCEGLLKPAPLSTDVSFLNLCNSYGIVADLQNGFHLGITKPVTNLIEYHCSSFSVIQQTWKCDVWSPQHTFTQMLNASYWCYLWAGKNFTATHYCHWHPHNSSWLFSQQKRKVGYFFVQPSSCIYSNKSFSIFFKSLFSSQVLEALLHSCALLSPIPPHQKLMVVFSEKEKKSQIFFCTALINMAINHAACLNIFLFLSGAGDTVATTPTCGDPYRRTRGRGKSDRVWWQ